jgi:hypothetical protein
MVDPVTSWSLVKTIADATKKLYDVAKGLKDYETKQKLDEVLDELRELKQSASKLEDENREQREKLRFKSDQYEFRNPFWYAKDNPQVPLCAKCHSQHVAAPMSEKYTTDFGVFRQCLVCDKNYLVEKIIDTGQQVSYYSDDQNSY